MNRFYEFLRRHPTWVDSLWSLLPLFASAAFIAASFRSDFEGALSGTARYAAIPVTLALSVVIALRRRMPERMLLLAIGTGVAQVLVDVPTLPSNFAFLVIIFTNATRDVTWPSRVALVGGLLAPTIETLRWPDDNQDLFGRILGCLLLTVCFALAWVLGDSLRTRRAYYAQLEERASRLEREREAQAKVAVAAERARIARELHDVVAHNVSVMIVQADGGAYVMDTAPDQAKEALHTISRTGRQALTEMRRLLGVLRTGDHEDKACAYVPQPGVEQLGELIEQVRGTGLNVDFQVNGAPRPLPSGVELTAYRIVQEALTNTRKHGGPDAGASVRLTYQDDSLEVLAEDDGRGVRAERFDDETAGGADGLGHGLIGMRERVGMVGGELHTGLRPGGGFRINAVLPLRGKDPEGNPADTETPEGAPPPTDPGPSSGGGSGTSGGTASPGGPGSPGGTVSPGGTARVTEESGGGSSAGPGASEGSGSPGESGDGRRASSGSFGGTGSSSEGSGASSPSGRPESSATGDSFAATSSSTSPTGPGFPAGSTSPATSATPTNAKETP